jgi:hypothetical protein
MAELEPQAPRVSHEVATGISNLAVTVQMLGPEHGPEVCEPSPIVFASILLGERAGETKLTTSSGE